MLNDRILNYVRTLAAGAGILAGLAFLALYGGRFPVASAASGIVPDEDLRIYTAGLDSGWADWSWADHKLGDPAVQAATGPAIRFTPAQFRGIYLHHDVFASDGYRTLTFLIDGGTVGGQKVGVCGIDASNRFLPKVDIAAYLLGHTIPRGRFVRCNIPLADLRLADTPMSGICFQDSTNKVQTPVYLADVRLTAPHIVFAPNSIVLTVHSETVIGAIRPEIYGMAQPGTEHFKQLRLKLWRWGGNPATRYNWEKGNAWNAARDWEFRNGNYGAASPEDRKPSGVADKAIANGKTYGADALLTIPTMGWVARDDDNNNRSLNVPGQSGPPVSPGSEAIAGYDPAENRKRVSIRSLPRKGRPFADPPDLTDDAVYQDEWVSHLTHHFGRARDGGVRYYAMDNEPDLWDSTHIDMHPVQPDYDSLLKQFLDYAGAVKDVDPSAQITGPTSWGWTGYFFSPKDRGRDNFATHADRKAHGDMPFLAWFLQQVQAHDRKAGRRTLDVLDVHYYPQAGGVYTSGTDAPTNALRLRATRALWDPSYTDESWIAAPVALIPRMRRWIDRYYPGTRLGLTEWNWGADSTLNGGLAVAEVLGVLGREQVDLACYWALPAVGSPGFYAFKLYRNADGEGHGFGDVAVRSSSTDPNRISCFAGVDSQTGLPTMVLLNKIPNQSVTVALNITGRHAIHTAEGYRYSAANLKAIVRIPDLAVPGGRGSITLPPYSMTLLRCR